MLSIRHTKQTSKNVAETTFKLGASAVASEFCKWIQVGIFFFKYELTPYKAEQPL